MESIISLLQESRKASKIVQIASDKKRQEVLLTIADLLHKNIPHILEENQKDLVRMDDADPKKDRLLLNQSRIEGLIESLQVIASLSDPTNQIQSDKTLANGLNIQKISVPMGVVGAIFESRPNVTIHIAALAIKSGNACVLRGGSDAEYSNVVLVSIIQSALEKCGLPRSIVQLMPIDRKYVQELLEADRYVDIIIPRGSQGLIDYVRTHSKVPTIETGAGVCHTYVTANADLEKAKKIVINAKVQRPSVCNSLDTVVVDKNIAASFLPMLKEGFLEYKVDIYADEEAYSILKNAGYPFLNHADEEDFGREFLSYACSIKTVLDLNEAITHIEKYSSRHSEAIISEDKEQCELFMASVDAAAVYSNASTRFTDGGEFGLGAEIGISTQKLHARGPFALEKLTTEKWIVRGNGQIR